MRTWLAVVIGTVVVACSGRPQGATSGAAEAGLPELGPTFGGGCWREEAYAVRGDVTQPLFSQSDIMVTLYGPGDDTPPSDDGNRLVAMSMNRKPAYIWVNGGPLETIAARNKDFERPCGDPAVKPTRCQIRVRFWQEDC